MTLTRYTFYSDISARKTKGKDHSGWSTKYTIWFLWNAPYIKLKTLREEQCLIDEQCLAVTACFILRQPVLFYGTSTGSTLHAHSSQVALATCTLFSLLLNTACTFFPLRSRPLPCFFVRPALLLPFFQFLSFFPAWSLLSPLDLFSTLWIKIKTSTHLPPSLVRTSGNTCSVRACRLLFCPLIKTCMACMTLFKTRMSLVGETHGTSGQCVSFSLIDAGSVLLPA